MILKYDQPETVLVVGAAGAVGRAVLDCIVRHPGLTAIAGQRRAGMLANIERPFVELRCVDATDARAVAQALRGCTLAVNAVGGRPANLLAATRALCGAARQAGLRRLVHISSMAVYGGEATGLADENTPFARMPNPYEAAKIACEAEVQAYIGEGREAVILRPGIVFGAGSAQWALRLARLLRARRLGDLGAAGDGFCNLTQQDDLGAAVISALLTPNAANLAFNVATDRPDTWNGFLVAFARMLRATPVRRITARRFAVETRLLAPALQIAKLTTQRVGMNPGWLPDAIPPSLARLFAQRVRLDPALADRILAFPRTADAPAMTAVARSMTA